MYAVVFTGGKQFKVSAGDVIEVEKLYADAGQEIELPAIMSVDGETVKTGADVAVKVKALVLKHNKTKKIVVFKYKAKKNERKKQGHRQPFTRIKITSIG